MVFRTQTRDDVSGSPEDNIIIACDCVGICSMFRVTRSTWNHPWDDDHDIDYYISHYGSAFDYKQDKFRWRVKNRLKAAWFALRGKEFHLEEICVSKENMKELVKVFNEWVEKDEEIN